jgi:hypothetical protein
MISAMSKRMTTPNNTPIQVMQYVLFKKSTSVKSSAFLYLFLNYLGKKTEL